MNCIELIGLPGCGKTSVRQRLTAGGSDRYFLSEKAALARALRAAGRGWAGRLARRLPLPCVTYKAGLLFNLSPSKAAAQSRFLAQHPDSLQAYLQSASFETMAVEERAKVLSWFFELAARYCTIGDHACDVTVVLDEGFLLRSMSLFVSPSSSGSDEANVLRYLRDVPAPDLLIAIDSDEQTCLERLDARGAGRRSNTRLRMMQADDSTAMTFLTRCRMHLERVVEWSRGNGTTAVSTIRNSAEDGIEDVVASARRIVEEFRDSVFDTGSVRLP